MRVVQNLAYICWLVSLVSVSRCNQLKSKIRHTSLSAKAHLKLQDPIIDEYSPVGRLQYAERTPMLDEKEATLPMEAELAMISGKVLGGGTGAVKGLIRAHSLANMYEGRDKVSSFAPLGLACKLLMSRESTPDNPRSLCQSLLAKVTDMPVSSQGVVEKTGEGIGKITTVTVPSPTRMFLPDREVRRNLLFEKYHCSLSFFSSHHTLNRWRN